MSDTTACVCGVPRQANYLVEAVVYRDDETVGIDEYYCAEHVPSDKEEGDAIVRYREPFDGKDWFVLEWTSIHLRGDV